MIIIFRKLKKFYQKIAKAGVIKRPIIIPFTPEIMRQLIIKPWRRSLGPWSRKNDQKFKNIQKIEKIASTFKNGFDIRILKNIPSHL